MLSPVLPLSVSALWSWASHSTYLSFRVLIWKSKFRWYLLHRVVGIPRGLTLVQCLAQHLAHNRWQWQWFMCQVHSLNFTRQGLNQQMSATQTSQWKKVTESEGKRGSRGWQQRHGSPWLLLVLWTSDLENPARRTWRDRNSSALLTE